MLIWIWLACGPTMDTAGEPDAPGAVDTAPDDDASADDTAADDTADADGSGPGDTGGPGDTADPSVDDTADPDDTAVEWPAVHLVIDDVGFDGPESMIYDRARDRYLVSNINGSSGAYDGDGFVSWVDVEGGVVALKWIDGEGGGFELNAPKGMTILGDALYVADLDHLRSFDLETGAHLEDRSLPGGNANDVAVGPDGALYVTDTSGGALYRVDPSGGAATTLVDGIGNPNGIAGVSDGLVVLDFGSGDVSRYGLDGARADLLAPPTASLDGAVALADGGLLISSWGCDCLYRLDPEGTAWTIAVEGVSTPADIGLDDLRGRALIPQLGGDAAQIHTLPEP